MTQSVWKFEISRSRDERVDMPKGARVTTCGFDAAGSLCIWAIVNLDETRKEVRQFGIFGTGGRIMDGHIYCGTVFSMPFVWHVFEIMGNSLD